MRAGFLFFAGKYGVSVDTEQGLKLYNSSSGKPGRLDPKAALASPEDVAGHLTKVGAKFKSVTFVEPKYPHNDWANYCHIIFQKYVECETEKELNCNNWATEGLKKYCGVVIKK